MSNLKVNTINDASGGSNAVLYGVASPPNSMGFRNRIINGEMRIDQRNAGASVTQTTGLVYPVDRFATNGSVTSKFTAQRSTVAPAGFINSLLITSSAATSLAATDYYLLRQAIEGFNTADFAFGSAGAQSVTMSFWVRSSLTGTFGGSLLNASANRCYAFSYSISAANTWEYKTVTIAGDTTGTWATDNTVGLYVDWSLGAGASVVGTAGSWGSTVLRAPTGQTSVVGTSGATFYITGVQLEAGSVASPFERRDYGRELMMCQRYCWVINSTGQDTMWGSGRWEGNLGYIQLVYPVVMRSQPSISLSTASGLQLVDPAVAWHNVTALNGIHKNGLRSMDAAFLTGTSITAGRATILAVNSGSPTATISAEL